MSEIEAVLAFILAKAHGDRESAGMNGSWGDGGAGALETQVKFYRYGMQGIVPPEWSKYVEKVQHQADPEYETFLRLKEKFRSQ
jgi:hypothetical protein